MTEPSTRVERGEGAVRPGAMTTVMRAVAPSREGPRWLRFAVVEAGRIVREEVLPPARALTIGANGDLHAAGPTRVLAHYADGAWRLAVSPGWRGRLASGAFVARDAHEIELTGDGRARLEIADGVALLLQLVDRPPARVSPALPAALSTGLLARADWTFTAFVTGSFLLHFAVVAFLMEADRPAETGIPGPRIIAELYYPPPPEPVDPPSIEETDDTSDDAVTEAPSEARAERPTTPGPRAPARDQVTPTMSRDDITTMRDGIQLMLGTLLAREGSATDDLLRNGAPTGSAEDVLAQVDGVTTADASAMMGERTGTGRVGDPRGDLGRLAARPGNDGEAVEEGGALPEVTIRLPRPDDVEPIGPVAFDPAELHRLLGRRMGAIRACYEHELTRGVVQGGGRMTLTMQVMPVGSLAGVRAAENTTGSDSLAACAVRSIRNVRVQRGPEQPVEVRYPIVFSRQE